MRKLAWILFFLVIAGTVLITLGAVDFAGIGTWFGTTMQNSVLSPSRNFIVEQWLFIGTNGWYILATCFGISILGAIFWGPIFIGLFIKKGIESKVLGKKLQSTQPITVTQPAPAPTPLALVQNIPIATPTPIEKLEEEK